MDSEAIASVSTGQPDLDKKLGGGIPLGSLTLLEGQSDSGKSVVGQQLWADRHMEFGPLAIPRGVYGRVTWRH